MKHKSRSDRNSVKGLSNVKKVQPFRLKIRQSYSYMADNLNINLSDLSNASSRSSPKKQIQTKEKFIKLLEEMKRSETNFNLHENICDYILDNLNIMNSTFKRNFDDEQSISIYEELTTLRDQYNSNSSNKDQKSNSKNKNMSIKSKNAPANNANNMDTISLNEESKSNLVFENKYVKFSDEEKQRIFGEINENSKGRKEKYNSLLIELKNSMFEIVSKISNENDYLIQEEENNYIENEIESDNENISANISENIAEKNKENIIENISENKELIIINIPSPKIEKKPTSQMNSGFTIAEVSNEVSLKDKIDLNASNELSLKGKIDLKASNLENDNDNLNTHSYFNLSIRQSTMRQNYFDIAVDDFVPHSNRTKSDSKEHFALNKYLRNKERLDKIKNFNISIPNTNNDNKNATPNVEPVKDSEATNKNSQMTTQDQIPNPMSTENSPTHEKYSRNSTKNNKEDIKLYKTSMVATARTERQSNMNTNESGKSSFVRHSNINNSFNKVPNRQSIKTSANSSLKQSILSQNADKPTKLKVGIFENDSTTKTVDNPRKSAAVIKNKNLNRVSKTLKPSSSLTQNKKNVKNKGSVKEMATNKDNAASEQQIKLQSSEVQTTIQKFSEISDNNFPTLNRLSIDTKVVNVEINSLAPNDQFYIPDVISEEINKMTLFDTECNLLVEDETNVNFMPSGVNLKKSLIDYDEDENTANILRVRGEKPTKMNSKIEDDKTSAITEESLVEERNQGICNNCGNKCLIF